MTQPVPPSDVTIMNDDALVLPMVSNAFEEYSTSQWRELQSLDADVGSIIVPGICPNSISNEAREKAIEVEGE